MKYPKIFRSVKKSSDSVQLSMIEFERTPRIIRPTTINDKANFVYRGIIEHLPNLYNHIMKLDNESRISNK